MFTLVEECWIDSWRWCGTDEFVIYRINCRRESENWRVNRRYSEFHEFHNKTMNWFDLDTRRAISSIFPGKHPFTSQTSLFIERRCKALDAYLQLFLHSCGKIESFNREQVNLLKEFFGASEQGEKSQQSENVTLRVRARTPNGINTELDRLRKIIHTDRPDINTNKIDLDLKAVQVQINSLQEQRKIDEDQRVIEKFYDLKREWEVFKIKAGIFDVESFKIEQGSANLSETAQDADITHTKYSKDSTDDARSHTYGTNDTKQQLRGQEVILKDLAVTLEEQKELSKEIYSEILEQNRIVGEVSRKQDGTKDEFLGATSRARKLQ